MASSIGKQVADDLYLHSSTISECLLPDLLTKIDEARQRLPLEHAANVVKINIRTHKLSWLEYEDFDSAPFPRLLASWSFDMAKATGPTFRNYRASLNPPILHRKELLVALTHPGRDKWEELSRVAEALGFFDDSHAIGFQLNWIKTIESKGYQLVGDSFHPLGNKVSTYDGNDSACADFTIQRHLTALSRSSLSAPVQLLLRYRLLKEGTSFFDYGCGRGNDIESLCGAGLVAAGWDPHYANDHPKLVADVVNLGFVVNVIEDAAERVEALHQAFSLTRGVMAVGVMLHPTQVSGVAYQDGVLTSRSTFQKYFTQGEIKAFVEDVLQNEAFMVGPGVAFVFANKVWQQSFEAARYRRTGIAGRLIASVRKQVVKVRSARASAAPRTSRSERQLEQYRTLLNGIWTKALDLGRFPEREELDTAREIESAIGSFGRALRLLTVHYDMGLLAKARTARMDDLTVYLAIEQFSKRKRYKNLEPRIQRDIKTFFGDYNSAQSAGIKLLTECADTSKLSEACVRAAAEGLGCLEEGHSLQLHVSLVERLPAVLRAYVACGLVLWESLSEVQIVKIHIGSGKLTLLEFDDFDTAPLPALRRRIKVNLRKLDYQIFEYGSAAYPKPLMFFKSRYLNEEYPGYAEQLAFDDQLQNAGIIEEGTFGPNPTNLDEVLASKRLEINGMQLSRCTAVPDLDAPCGRHLTYRSLIECGETQARLNIANIPTNVATFNALFDLVTNIIDPVIDYFGGIQLTYGLCTAELGRHVHKRVAHDRDQHAAHEYKRGGRYICERLGAACDFIVIDEDMLQVAKWIAANCPFDRLYFYGRDRPVHVSYAPTPTRQTFRMLMSKNNHLIPRQGLD